MGRLIRIISIYLAMVLLVGCEKKNKNEIVIDIGLKYSDAGELVTAPLEYIKEKLIAWEKNHPINEIKERDRIANSDFSHLAVMGSNHLPDVFITDCLTGRLLAQAGLVKEVDAQDVGTFTYNGKTYAFPALREYVSAVIYDPVKWETGDPVAYSEQNGISLSVDYLSVVADPEWTAHMTAGDKEAAFTDQQSLEALEAVKELVANDISYSSVSTLTQAFVNGEISAVVLYGDDVYRLLEKVKEKNLDLYNRISFTTLENELLPYGYQYGLFINAGLEGDKLNTCMDLAKELGEAYEEDLGETIDRLEKLKSSTEHRPLMSQCFSNYFWMFAREECFSQLLLGEKNPEEYASILQNYYEQYYLNVEDYSTKFDKYGIK